jgi:hypothetical protein
MHRSNNNNYFRIFMPRAVLVVSLSIFFVAETFSQMHVESKLRLGRVKYTGGGDWYNDPSSDINILRFVAQEAGIDTDPVYEFVELSSDKLPSYPILFLTGHGNIGFSELEIQRLRSYLMNGGFLYVDDDYGLDKSFRREMKKVFPESNLIELPFDSEIYRQPFRFPSGPPKTHEHDNKPPQGFGIFYKGRMVVYYTFESNPSDGWADPDVHRDPESVRQEALRFGTNIIVFALTH